MEKETTVNGITFLTFCTQLRGYSVLNKNNKPIPKYLLFWNRVSIDDVFIKYKIVSRI